MCRTPAQLAAALVTSVDPCIVKKKSGDTESEELQGLQRRLLGTLEREWRDALYPAAACTLADLRDVRPGRCPCAGHHDPRTLHSIATDCTFPICMGPRAAEPDRSGCAARRCVQKTGTWSLQCSARQRTLYR